MVGYVPARNTILTTASDEDLDILERRIGEERQRRIDEQAAKKARYERDGCKWNPGFIYGFCETCGCDEISMDQCEFGGPEDD